MSNPLIVTDKSPKFLLGVQRDVMNSERYVGGVDLALDSMLHPEFTATGDGLYPANPVLAISGSWEDGTVLSRVARTNWWQRSNPTSASQFAATSGCTVGGGNVVYPPQAINAYVYAPWGPWGASGVPIWVSWVQSPDADRGSVSFAAGGAVPPLSAVRTVRTLPDGRIRVDQTGLTPDSSNITTFRIVVQNTSQLTISNLSIASGPGRFIPTAGSPVTETDATWTQSTGRIVLARALDIGAVVTRDTFSGSMISPTIWQSPSVISNYTSTGIRPDGSCIITFAEDVPDTLTVMWSNAPDGGTIARIDARNFILRQKQSDPTLVPADLDAVIKANEQLEVRGGLTIYNNLTINGKLYITQELGF